MVLRPRGANGLWLERRTMGGYASIDSRVRWKTGLAFSSDMARRKNLLDFPQVVIGGHDRLSDHHGRLDVGDVALVAGGLAGPLD
ncbi:hypothetical protein [Rhodococcus sp. NCIMB 12038]|uniref:hypothetical protein n=1 Tax=Rhodococcus sp. NCIMB 12038 TaxID=933800 RepID=UPI00117B3174|nr:hypothetical protein [Rhodococcus sp. NCIMB 12038]